MSNLYGNAKELSQNNFEKEKQFERSHEQNQNDVVFAKRQRNTSTLQKKRVMYLQGRFFAKVTKVINATFWHLPKRSTNMCPYIDVHMNVYSSVIFNNQLLAMAPTMSEWSFHNIVAGVLCQPHLLLSTTAPIFPST